MVARNEFRHSVEAWAEALRSIKQTERVRLLASLHQAAAEPSDCTNSGPSAHSQPATQSLIGGGVEWMPMSSDMQS
eukprot:g79655.t1